jgi:hypothetical protein
MKNNLQSQITILIKSVWMLPAFFVLISALPVLAQSCPYGVPVCIRGISSLTDPEGVLGVIMQVTGFIAYILGAVAVLAMFNAGYLFMTAGDSQERQSRAKAWLKWGLIGIVVAVFSSAIVSIIASLLSGDLLDTF